MACRRSRLTRRALAEPRNVADVDGGVSGRQAILAFETHHPGDARTVRRDGGLFEIAHGSQLGEHVVERGLREGCGRDEDQPGETHVSSVATHAQRVPRPPSIWSSPPTM